VAIRQHLLASLLFFGALTPVAAAPFQNATVRRIIDGRQVYIDDKQAQVNQTAFKGQQLRTGNSRTELLFDRRAIGFLGRNSRITLGADCFKLGSGTVLVNGPQSSCLGSKVLGVRGTTYVLSSTDDGGYELSVLTGEATLEDSTTPFSGKQQAQESETDILSLYPKLSSVIGLGSSAWGSNAGGKNLGQAAGLILGDLSFFAPLVQDESRSILYNYSTGSSNFDGFWGLSSELGYTWFDSNNRSSSNALVGYDGWQDTTCFHSQIAVGAQWQRNRWQLSANGGIPIDRCENQLGFAMAQVGIPISNLGEESIQLTLAPYVMRGIGNSYGGGRIGINIPFNNQLNFSAYGQYDDLLNSVVGGQITYRFATAGRFVRDPNLPTPGQRSPIPWQNKAFNNGQPIQIALAKSNSGSNPATNPSVSDRTSESTVPLLSQTHPSIISAGESARFDSQGNLLSRERLSRERYQALITSNLEGQRLLPESHAIAMAYQQLYGTHTPIVLAITGFDWLIAARTPFPRLRGSNNLVIPSNKLPGESTSHTPDNKPKVYTYACYGFGTGGTQKHYYNGTTAGTTEVSQATRFTTKDKLSTNCSDKTSYYGSPATSVEWL